ncbi:helix-turn-helix transcriptional regulator [Actinoplanes sp. NEAU-A12]|uniref:Helix-turn-helix transcriptional regulator n=1 Tax=Actinoplanes sandaracinus TaxID=3045177 RepID=A0ABT6WEK9_9ACTN|nr:helix-turn-helix transcriptional regulator [Actinoplanes sandaracinus]MDI6098174.1 helix-turn-helix transcriptional regulator [Actinoplanes sandaracinus]
MALSFGAELRARRLAAGVSLTRFARAVNYSKSHISKIENGMKVPGTLLARICDAALDADGKLAALAPAVRPSAAEASATEAGHESPWVLELDPSGRGRFGAATTVAEWPSMPGTPRDAGHLVDAFRVQFDNLRRMTQFMPPAAMIPILITGTRAVRLTALPAPEPARSRLLLLAGRYAELTGWMAQESGDDASALWWTGLAVRFAAEGGDHHIAAYADVRRADIAMYQRNGAKTISLAQRVQDTKCSSRVLGLAAQREAQGHALQGDYDACRHALDRAATWLNQPDDTAAEPVLGTSTVHDPIAMAADWCLYDLGRPEQAGQRLIGQLNQTPMWASRTRARLGARYALGLLAAGRVEEGCAALETALDDSVGLGSATIRTDLLEAGRHLNRRPADLMVRAVMPRLIEALGAGV